MTQKRWRSLASLFVTMAANVSDFSLGRKRGLILKYRRLDLAENCLFPSTYPTQQSA